MTDMLIIPVLGKLGICMCFSTLESCLVQVVPRMSIPCNSLLTPCSWHLYSTPACTRDVFIVFLIDRPSADVCLIVNACARRLGSRAGPRTGKEERGFRKKREEGQSGWGGGGGGGF